MNTKKLLIVIVLLAVALIVIGIVVGNKKSKSSPLGVLAQCIKDSGAKFYGAFWCPHCQKQKQMFGSSVKLLPYVECSTPDGKSQTPVCQEQKIEGYPTWKFDKQISLSSTSSPELCKTPYDPAQPAGCKDINQGYKGYIVTNKTETVVVQSTEAPTESQPGIWSFNPHALISGEVEPVVLGEAVACPIPEGI